MFSHFNFKSCTEQFLLKYKRIFFFVIRKKKIFGRLFRKQNVKKNTNFNLLKIVLTVFVHQIIKSIIFFSICCLNLSSLIIVSIPILTVYVVHENSYASLVESWHSLNIERNHTLSKRYKLPEIVVNCLMVIIFKIFINYTHG